MGAVMFLATSRAADAPMTDSELGRGHLKMPREPRVPRRGARDRLVHC
jgi:hypothetical protein